MIRTTPRTARKPHRCQSDAEHRIRPGERYLEHVAAPQHGDLGNDHWWRLAECADCARRYDRGELLDREQVSSL